MMFLVHRLAGHRDRPNGDCVTPDRVRCVISLKYGGLLTGKNFPGGWDILKEFPRPCLLEQF